MGMCFKSRNGKMELEFLLRCILYASHMGLKKSMSLSDSLLGEPEFFCKAKSQPLL